MAKKKKSSSGAGKGKSAHLKSGASVDPGKAAQTLKEMSRSDFIKMAGISAAATAFGATVLANSAKAQPLPPGCPNPHDPENPDYKTYFTLAAFIDTVVPGELDVPVPIFVVDHEEGDPQNGYIVCAGVMNNLGADGTDKQGAAACPNSYNYFHALAPILSHEGYFLQLLEGALDLFVAPFSLKFNQLPYDDFTITDPNTQVEIGVPGRYTILYLMDKPDLLVPLLVQQGHTAEYAFEQAANVKKLFTLSLYLTYTVAYSEVCNLHPSGAVPVFLPDNPIPVSFLPVYERNEDNTWNVIEDSMWHQMEYPGPSYKEPSYATEYDGLRVTIADGKVKFEK
jgi:hypothetical protein